VKTELLILRTTLLPPSLAKDGPKTVRVSAATLIHDVEHFYITSFPFLSYMQDRVDYREQGDHKIDLLSSFFEISEKFRNL